MIWYNEHFIDIRFERRHTGDWCCHDVQGELLSPDFFENLVVMLHPFIVLEQSVALPTCLRMHFPEKFPFLLRQALIALVLPYCNTGVQAIIECDCGSLMSEFAMVVPPGYSENPVREHAERIKEEYERLSKKGSIAIHLLEDGASQMTEQMVFDVSNSQEFLAVANKMDEIGKSGKKVFLAWKWGMVEYFEYITMQ